MPEPKVETQTAPGGGTRTTMSFSDGTKVQVTKGSKGTSVKTTSSTGKSTTVFTDNDGNQKVIDG